MRPAANNIQRQQTGFQMENFTTLVANVPGNRHPASDLPAFFTAALVLTLAGLAATHFPALRATRVDPIAALRME